MISKHNKKPTFKNLTKIQKTIKTKKLNKNKKQKKIK